MEQTVLSPTRRRPSPLVRLVPSTRSLAVGTASVVLAGALYACARETSMFAVRHFVVRGASPQLAAQIRAALAELHDENLLGLDGPAVIRRLERLPSVMSATYDRAFPHTLVVRVVPEMPVAVIRSGRAAWLVSARGRVVGPVDRTRYRSLPRVWLPRGANLETGSFLSGDAAASARALRAFVASRFAQRVAWGRVRNGQLTLGLRSRLELRFGASSDLALKIAVVRSILPDLRPLARGGGSYLDVSVPDRPVTGGTFNS